MTLSRTSRAARKIMAVVWAAGMLGVASCSAVDNAISLEETRKLGGSTKAEQARQNAEKHLVAIAHTYDKETPLTLALVTVKDYCASGSGGALPSGDDTYKIRCTVDVTGYYGADRDRIGDVMDGVLSAGDRQASATTPGEGIDFGHDDYRNKLVAYYRGHGPNPSGPDTTEPTQLSDGSQTLEWDMVRTKQHQTLIEEPPACGKPDPPVTRCSHKPESDTVADIRGKYGMVFKMSMTPVNYYQVYKDGKTYTNW
ncbi:hypothetical protein [Streptomyces hygroscopicus]|uniref:hypothetical protein n=1 Tax=Streptomyces hygroscopicus TaxID=1912 RepID=UPI0004C8509E|nr:hypothetical protein [Streptomyces hygroscopicus]